MCTEKKMKISIITVVYNNKSYLEDAILSVKNQTYKNIEHIIVDGGSTDGTVEIIKKHSKLISNWISEPDSGIYDAMNKGINLSTGELIGILNSDDIYFHENVIKNVVSLFKQQKMDGCYGDLIYVSENLKNTIRHWKSSEYKKGLFKSGWMPPHPTFFVRKKIYERFGDFNCSFKISADYELMLRFIEKNHICIYYVPEILIKMRVGGKSNRGIMNLIRKSLEDYKAWKVNGLKISPVIVLKKPFSKLNQFFKLK